METKVCEWCGAETGDGYKIDGTDLCEECVRKELLHYVTQASSGEIDELYRVVYVL